MGSAVDRFREISGASAPIDPAELEASLAQISGVRAVRLVRDPGGIVSEVHVLAETGRAPKQLVRDIQSVAIARYGLEIDYRKISIVQLEQASEEAGSRGQIAPRAAVLRIASEIEGDEVRAEVRLGLPDRQVSGAAHGLASSGLRLVATAVLNALSSIGGITNATVEFADTVSTPAGQAALVVVRAPGSRTEHITSGSAMLRRDPQDAIARATLAAVNRLIEFR